MNSLITAPISSNMLGEAIHRIFDTGKITREDKNVLLRATASNYSLTVDELHQVRRVFDRLQMGLLKVVD
ncbi:MAG: hypothetical protein ACFE0I_14150 [Elainellaceae cyanobacterium]